MTDKDLTPQEEPQTPDSELEEKQPEEIKPQEEKQVEKQEDKDELVEVKAPIKRVTKAELVAEMDDLKEDVELLSTQVTQKDSEISTLKAQIEKLTLEIEKQKNHSDKYNTMLQEVIQEKKNSVPKEIQELLPEGLELEQQLAWLNKANETGKALKKEVPVVEIGKPMNLGQQAIDTEGMTPHQKLSSYFAQVFSK